jgi:hypothetical protein
MKFRSLAALLTIFATGIFGATLAAGQGDVTTEPITISAVNQIVLLMNNRIACFKTPSSTVLGELSADQIVPGQTTFKPLSVAYYAKPLNRANLCQRRLTDAPRRTHTRSLRKRCAALARIARVREQAFTACSALGVAQAPSGSPTPLVPLGVTNNLPQPSPTGSPTANGTTAVSPTASGSVSPSVSGTLSPVASATVSPLVTASASPFPTASPTLTLTASPLATLGFGATFTPSIVITPSTAPTPSPTFTLFPSAGPTTVPSSAASTFPSTAPTFPSPIFP